MKAIVFGATKSAMNVIKNQLLDMGIEERRINTSYVDFRVRARESFLRCFAMVVYQQELSGCVAEGETVRKIKWCKIFSHW